MGITCPAVPPPVNTIVLILISICSFRKKSEIGGKILRKNRAGPGAAGAEKSGRGRRKAGGGVPRIRGGGAGGFVLDRAAETRGRAVNAVRIDEGRNGRGKKTRPFYRRLLQERRDMFRNAGIRRD